MIFHGSVFSPQILDEFAAKYPPSSWPSATEATINFPQIKVYLAKYQNPREADAMTKIQEDLDETKIILVNNSYFIHIIVIFWSFYSLLHKVGSILM